MREPLDLRPVPVAVSTTTKDISCTSAQNGTRFIPRNIYSPKAFYCKLTEKARPFANKKYFEVLSVNNHDYSPNGFGANQCSPFRKR